jgi:hypothetical protein
MPNQRPTQSAVGGSTGSAAMKTAEKLELDYLRKVMIGILEVTVEDLTDERKLQTVSNQNEQALNKAEALTFIRSSAFDVVCDIVGVPACRIRTKCLK